MGNTSLVRPASTASTRPQQSKAAAEVCGGGSEVWQSQLGKTKGPNGEKRKQMQDEWVTDVPPDRLKKAGLDRKQQKEIREGLKDGDGSVGKVVIRTNNKGEPKAKTVNSKGNIVRGNKGIYEL
jgi:hypothetical protein